MDRRELRLTCCEFDFEADFREKALKVSDGAAVAHYYESAMLGASLFSNFVKTT